MRKVILFFTGVGLIANGFIATGIILVWCSLSMDPVD